MKPKHKIISLPLPPTRLYIDDILAIESLFKNNCESYVVDTPDCQWENIDELVNSKIDRVDIMSIKGKNPDINLNFGKHDADISTYSDEENMSSFAYLLKDKIIGRRNIFLYILKNDKWMMVLFAIPYALAIIMMRDSKLGLPVSVLILLLYFIYIFGFQSVLRIPKYNIIRLYKRGEGSGFLHRNKDKLILMLLASIIGSAFTILFQYIFLK